MVKINLIKILFFIIFFFSLSCSNDDQGIDGVILSVKEHFVPDPRVGIFEINLKKDRNVFLLEGETDNHNALKALIDSLDRLHLVYENNVDILPEEQLEGQNRALVNISVCNIRRESRHSSELLTQGILGTPLKVLKKKGAWFLIQTPDKYLGWVDEGGIELLSREESDAYSGREKIIFNGIYGFSYQKPEEASTTVSDLTSGNILFLEETMDSYYKVSYPDGRIAYVKKSESELFDIWLSENEFDPEKLISMGFSLLGVPYLWGGTSSKGMDCSGFTKILYLMNGYVIPRDASQQENIGNMIDDKKAFEKLQEGDLLFFGRAATDSTPESVVHVGMWIGDMKFIHASGDIHVSSMDPDSEVFDEYNLKRYLRTKRLAGSDDEENLAIEKRYFSIFKIN